MLLLGVLQAQAAGAAVAGSFDLLETQVLGTAVASVTFSSLSTYAADYQHLQIRAVARTTGSNSGAGVLPFMRLNGDSGSNYKSHSLFGNGSSVVSSTAGDATLMYLPRIADSATTANGFGAYVTDLLDPFETTKNTTIRSLGGSPASTSYIWMSSGAWFNTNAVTSILMQPSEAGDWAIGSRFSLYGLKAGA